MNPRPQAHADPLSFADDPFDPIEEWTIDEFDRFADLRDVPGAWAAADDFDH